MWQRIRELERRLELYRNAIRDLQKQVTALQNQLRNARGGS